MERLDGGSAVPAAYRGGIVALGNFDGFHKGHQAVVGRAVERARAEGSPALVATFDPHPMRYFRPDSPWFRLTTMDQRARLLEAAGVDAMFVFHFDEAFAALTPEGFVTDWLAGRLGAAGVITGRISPSAEIAAAMSACSRRWAPSMAFPPRPWRRSARAARSSRRAESATRFAPAIPRAPRG